MSEKKDYSKLTLEELKLEETKLNKTSKTIGIIAALSCGVTLYAIFKGNVGFIHWALPLGCGLYLGKMNENMKAIKKEIFLRNLK